MNSKPSASTHHRTRSFLDSGTHIEPDNLVRSLKYFRSVGHAAPLPVLPPPSYYHSTVYPNDLSRNPARVLPCQEDRNGSLLLRGADPVERAPSPHVSQNLLALALEEEVCSSWSGSESVDIDTLLGQIFRQYTSELVDGTLRSSIEKVPRRYCCPGRHAGADEDDLAANGYMRSGLLDKKYGTSHIQVEVNVKINLGHLF